MMEKTIAQVEFEWRTYWRKADIGLEDERNATTHVAGVLHGMISTGLESTEIPGKERE